MNRKEITEHYRKNREEIESRLEQFKELRDSSEERKFKELVFVILTSQTEAEKAWEATEKLDSSGKLLEGGQKTISEVLENFDITYSENKAGFIVENRGNLSQPTLSDPQKELKLSSRIDEEDFKSTRDWLAENITGISWKGASHFLRNIGYGDGFAIISRHISSQMVDLGLLEDPEPPRNRDEYMEKENILKEFSESIEIDIKGLDLVLWSMKTGKVFK